MTLVGVLMVLLGGGVGAPTRYLVEIWLVRRAGTRWPYGTFAVNIVGSLILGTLTGIALVAHLPQWLSLLLGMGFCGALTTFSGFTLQVVELTREGPRRPDGTFGASIRGFAYASLSLGLGLLAAACVPLLVSR